MAKVLLHNAGLPHTIAWRPEGAKPNHPAHVRIDQDETASVDEVLAKILVRDFPEDFKVVTEAEAKSLAKSLAEAEKSDPEAAAAEEARKLEEGQ